ncbi:hypothetical protein Y032_0009g541 [Ancylostoma ceylanicum]|uniref:Uncharacterized protein n=1 Tax=Ancylostoma ceylanicum TaxID=53326 RepID=A0A016VIA0_9BILA|nr:hypothetical protein Y032_0009g541 [Ancylostoma ceylanicum]
MPGITPGFAWRWSLKGFVTVIQAQLRSEMKSVFVILACCVIATFSCPKTTTIDRSDFNNAAFVSVVEVQSVSGNWETMVLGVKEKIALKVVSAFPPNEDDRSLLFFLIIAACGRYFMLLGDSASKNPLFRPRSGTAFPIKSRFQKVVAVFLLKTMLWVVTAIMASVF